MTGKEYYHAIPPSLESRLIQFFMGLFGMKRAMERKILKNGCSKQPAPIITSILKHFIVDVEEFSGRKIWTISPKNTESNTKILFLHGGAYYANITKMHWGFIEQIIKNTNSTLIVPDYPLAPESTCIDTFQFLDTVYAKLISDYPSKRIVFMGDSAGGGLALGFAQKIRNDGAKQPAQIILISPWLDVSLSNPDIARVEIFDKILSVNGLRAAGRQYAGYLEATDYRISPIYGNFANLGRISLFIGTHDVLVADARKLKYILDEQQIDFNYFEYPGMFHDWVLAARLREARDVIYKITKCLNSIDY
jgi:acetyl esterase/lipase